MAQRLSIPNIDLGAEFRVIDDSGRKPIWKVLGRGYATKKVAQQFIVHFHLVGAWMVDDYGNRSYISGEKTR